MLEIKSIKGPDIPGFQVSLEPVGSFQVRELRLHAQLFLIIMIVPIFNFYQ